MYLWKCWRDTRVRFVVTLILVTISTVLIATLSWKLISDSIASGGPAEKARWLFSWPIRTM